MKRTTSNLEKTLIRKYPTISICGLDCGLCPRYHTVGVSRCPGCCGPDFFKKHPSCAYITCCVKKRNLEICSECSEFPCQKLKQYTKCDSFLSHEKVMENLYLIKEIGIKKYVQQQKKRMKILENMLNNFDEGRSKSFYCIAATLLSIEDIENAFSKANQKISEEYINPKDIKVKARILRELFIKAAQKENIELQLRKKSK